MTQLAPIDPQIKTMTSREIADLVDSRHDKVKQSIERLAAKGLISKPPMGDGPKVAEQAPAVAAQALLAGADGSMCITKADRDNDARIDAWKARQRAADLRALQSRAAADRRAAAARCAEAYAARIGSAA